MQDESTSCVVAQAKVTKGKARFYSYKRKLQQFFENSNIRATKEGRVILEECFDGMKETIKLLGFGLDSNILDDEGSKLLDWAMIDCISTTNKLNMCNRCFLCRQKRKLIKSHVWPKFIIKRNESLSKPPEFIFGLDKSNLKSNIKCYFWMLCGRCEQILSQNGEREFDDKFPTSGKITYSSWLFSFCAGIIFRTLGITVQFPVHFNDNEIHKVLLHCRKHLLSLPVKTKGFLGSYNKRDMEALARKLKDNLDIFLFMSPLKSQVPYKHTAIELTRNKQFNSKSLNFNGYAHFLLVCCGPITLIVNFDQPVHSLKGGFRITSNAVDSDQEYTIPSEEERVKLLPVGVLFLMEELNLDTGKVLSEVHQSLSKNAKIILTTATETSTTKTSTTEISTATSTTKTSTTEISTATSTTKTSTSETSAVDVYSGGIFQISLLPEEYEIINPHLSLPRNQCVTLPEGHQVICHATQKTSALNFVQTFLLCVKPATNSDPPELYVIYLSQNHEYLSDVLYIDAAEVKFEGGKLVLVDFLLKNVAADKMRCDLTGIELMQRNLDITMPNKHFDNVDFLMHLIKHRRYVKFYIHTLNDHGN